MAFSVHTFETNPEGNLGFAFHENIGEGQGVYFLSKFPHKTVEPRSIAEHIFGAVVDYLKTSKLSDNYDKFEESLKVANQESKKFGAKIPARPEIIIAFFDFHHLYLSQCGSAEAYLIRDGGVSQITEAPEDHEDLFLNILSGQVAVEDVVLLSSNRVLRTLTANELAEIFSRPNFQEATNIFKHDLAQKSEEDLLVTVIGIGKKESTPTAGFLSKVMTSKEKTVSHVPILSVETESNEEIPETLSVKKPFPRLRTSGISGVSFPKITKSFPKFSINFPQWQWPTNEIFGKLKAFRPQKNLLVLAGVVLVLFLLGIGIKSINWQSEEEIQLREQLDIARESLQQAETFLLQGDRDEAKIALEKANSSVQDIFKSQSKIYRSDAQFLLADIKSKQLQIENARQVTANLVADLTVKVEKADMRGLTELSGNLYAHDAKSVIKTVRNIVENPNVVSESTGSIIASNSRDDQKTLVFLTDDPRLIEYREGVVTPMQTQDENWKKGLDIKTYGRYLYVLSPTDNQIWKYERRRSNYSGSTAYNQGADLSEAVSFAIDGAIYVISANGGVQKIFRGQKVEYEFQNIPSVPFSGPNLKIYTATELDYLYVLDPDNERMLMFTKGEKFATYKRQIIYGLANVKDFVVDENGQKVSLITNDKIYEFSL